MPFTATPTDAYLHLAWYGVLTRDDLNDLAATLPRVAAELGYAPDVMHTFDRLQSAEIKPWAMFQYTLRRRDTQMHNAVKVAWVTDEPAIRRMGELFQELNRNPDIQIAVFESERAAKAWLGRGRGRQQQRPRRRRPVQA